MNTRLCILQVASAQKERDQAVASLQDANNQRDRQTEQMDKMEVGGASGSSRCECWFQCV